jgi:hypothetical protein
MFIFSSEKRAKKIIRIHACCPRRAAGFIIIYKQIMMNMLCREKLERISRAMSLTPYQLYMLEINSDKYNLHRLVKCGDVLYAPYRCQMSNGILDCMKKIFIGPRADLIGTDRLLAFNKRGIKP